MSSQLRVSEHINATAERVFSLVSDPARHHEFDASNMVGAPTTTTAPNDVGDVFTMNMRRRNAAGEVMDYQTDNHVTAWTAPQVIEWAVAGAGQEPFDWRWRYEIQPDGDGSQVTLAYDWSHASDDVVKQFHLPVFGEDNLKASLDQLKSVLEA